MLLNETRSGLVSAAALLVIRTQLWKRTNRGRLNCDKGTRPWGAAAPTLLLHSPIYCTTAPPCGCLSHKSEIVQFKTSLTCFAVVAVEALREVQTSNLLLKKLHTCGIHLSRSCWSTRHIFLCHLFELLLNVFQVIARLWTKGGEEWDLLNCIMKRPVTSPFRKVSVHSRQSVQVCRMCPLWSDRFSWNHKSKASILFSLSPASLYFSQSRGSLTAKCGGESRDGGVHLPEDAPITGQMGHKKDSQTLLWPCVSL